MFFFRDKAAFACGTLALMAARVLTVCLCHFANAACASEDCHPAHENAVCAEEHHAHEHSCECAMDITATVPAWRLAPDATATPFIAARADAADWAPLKIPKSARVEKPPPGLALKKISQRLC